MHQCKTCYIIITLRYLTVAAIHYIQNKKHYYYINSFINSKAVKLYDIINTTFFIKYIKLFQHFFFLISHHHLYYWYKHTVLSTLYQIFISWSGKNEHTVLILIKFVSLLLIICLHAFLSTKWYVQNPFFFDWLKT